MNGINSNNDYNNWGRRSKVIPYTLNNSVYFDIKNNSSDHIDRVWFPSGTSIQSIS